MRKQRMVRQTNGQLAMEYYVEDKILTQEPVEVGLFPPYFGEVGWWIMRHVRFVHQHPAKMKIVACQRGQEPLFPTAHDFYYDWENTIPDHLRGDDNDALAISVKAPIIARMQAIWQPATVCPTLDFGRTLLPVKFQLGEIPAVLPGVDVAICPRYREHVPQRNWPHWVWLADQLVVRGLKVGVVGSQESSQETMANVRAWEHPLGATAGTLDLLRHCKVYLGTDTGPSHLAALMDVSMILFMKLLHGSLMVNEIKAGTAREILDLGADGWDHPEHVLQVVLRKVGL